MSKPLARSLDIMDVVSAHPSGATMSEVAQALEIPAPTVYRMMRNLTELGYLRGEGRHSRYRLGQRFLRQYHNAASTRNLINAVRPSLRHLAATLDDVVYLNALVRDDIKAVCAEFPDTRSARAMVMPGDLFPIHATASGKVLCAYQEPEQQNRMMDSVEFTPYMENTIADRAQLEVELLQVKSQAYGLSDEEIEEGVFAVSVPIAIEGRGVIYSLGVNGTKGRMLEKRSLQSLVSLLHGTAREMGLLLRDAAGLHYQAGE